jgi:hypothetical protein
MLLPISAFAADLKFSGTLELLGRESISIRLPDRIAVDARLPNTSSLSAASIAAKYRLGDHVEIACKEINPILEEAVGRLLFIELTKIRFVRTASPDELAGTLRLPAWREPLNLLLPPDVRVPVPVVKMNDPPVLTDAQIEAHAKLERAREVNLNYIAHLPNFVADETGKRYTGEARFPDWRYLDKIETEITVKGNRSDRQKVRRDGKPWKQPYQFLPGFKWSGGFGTELRPIFDLRCPTTIDYSGTAVMHGKRVLEYRFESPADGCFGPFTNEYARYNPARKGRIFVEDFAGDRGGNVLQLEEEATDFPEQFEFSHRVETVSWDFVKIGDAPHLLPVAANFVVEYFSGSRVRVDVEYKNHRHFESSASISFQ